jgi:hypothetical protein
MFFNDAGCCCVDAKYSTHYRTEGKTSVVFQYMDFLQSCEKALRDTPSTQLILKSPSGPLMVGEVQKIDD